MTAGSIVVDLLMRTGSFETDTARAGKRLQQLKKEAIDTGKNIGIAFTAATTAFAYFISKTIDGIDALNDVADATGATVESISALERVAVRTGGNLESVNSILIKFNSVLKEAQPGKGPGAVLQALNLDIEQLKRLDPAEALRVTAVALSQYADDGDKARAVQELFGKSVKEAAPFLKDLAEQTKLVSAVTTEQAKAAEEFNKQLFQLRENAQSLARTLASALVPVLNQVFKDVATFGQKASLAGLASEVVAADKALKALQARQASPFNFAGNLSAELDAATKRLEAAKAAFNAADTGRPQGITGSVSEVRSTRSIPSLSLPPAVTGGGSRAGRSAPAERDAFFTDVPPDAAELARRNLVASRQGMGEGERKAIEDYNRLMEEGKRIYESTRTPLERLNIEEKRLNDLLAAGAIDADTMTRRLFELNEELFPLTDNVKSSTEELKSLGNELGLTFSSAFEDAIVGGKALSDVLKGLAQDVMRIVTRKLVTEPLGNFLTSAIGSFFGGFKAVGGDVLPDRSYVVGENGPEMFVPRTAGTILPNSSANNQSPRQNMINVNVTAVQGMSRDTALQQGARIGSGIQLALSRNA